MNTGRSALVCSFATLCAELGPGVVVVISGRPCCAVLEVLLARTQSSTTCEIHHTAPHRTPSNMRVQGCCHACRDMSGVVLSRFQDFAAQRPFMQKKTLSSFTK